MEDGTTVVGRPQSSRIAHHGDSAKATKKSIAGGVVGTLALGILSALVGYLAHQFGGKVLNAMSLTDLAKLFSDHQLLASVAASVSTALAGSAVAGLGVLTYAGGKAIKGEKRVEKESGSGDPAEGFVQVPTHKEGRLSRSNSSDEFNASDDEGGTYVPPEEVGGSTPSHGTVIHHRPKQTNGQEK